VDLTPKQALDLHETASNIPLVRCQGPAKRKQKLFAAAALTILEAVPQYALLDSYAYCIARPMTSERIELGLCTIHTFGIDAIRGLFGPRMAFVVCLVAF
jgi:hypothetical protein